MRKSKKVESSSPQNVVRDREKDLLFLADAFFHELMYVHHEAHDFGVLGLDHYKPFDNRDIEMAVLKIIKYDMSPYMCAHCSNFIDAEGEHTARVYARGLYDELGDFLRTSWAKYRGLISER